MSELIVSKQLGYCFGVRRAMCTLFDKLDETCHRKCYTFGPVIHNDRIISELKHRGVDVIHSVEDAVPGSLVFLRTHGVPAAIISEFERRGVECVDLVCPYVHRIHQIAKSVDSLIVAGDAAHPEVLGIVGNVQGKCFVTDNVNQLDRFLSDHPNQSFTMVAQTTFRLDIWNEMKEFVANRYRNTVFVEDTVCHATSDRQQEIALIAQQADVCVIIGDFRSSNTKKLYEIAKSFGPAYLVENQFQLPHNLNVYKKIGLSTGASTPDSTIQEVIHAMMNEENVVTNSLEEDIDFAKALEESFAVVHAGQRVSGTVGAIGELDVQLDLGGKHTGIIPVSEFSAEDLENLKIGDEIDAIVQKVNDQEGTALLSKRKIDSMKGFEKLETAKENGEILTGKVADVVKGGVVVLINSVRVFVPASLASTSRNANLEELKNQEVRIKITELTKEARRTRIIGSIRAVLDEEKKAAQDAFWSTAEVGKEYKGVVKSLVPFGAFVDLGGVDGLVHITELSWDKINHPKQVVKEGDEVNVTIKALDPETRKISLTCLKPDENPWKILSDSYAIGDVVPVKVLSLVPYGAFVSVIPGIDGLIHISQLAHHRVEKVADVLKVGQEIEAKIIDINYETKKISLSLKAALPEEEETVFEETGADNAESAPATQD